MEITVNKKPHSFQCESMPLTAVLDACQLPSTGIAVAINNQVIRKAAWTSTEVKAGDAVTVIQAVCGG